MIIQGVRLTNIAVYDTAIPTGSSQLLYLDAGNPASYPGSGTTWYDLSGRSNHTLTTQNTAYNSANGGYFNFTPNAWFTTASAKYNITYTGKTVFLTARLTSAMANNSYRCMFGSNGGSRNFNLYFYYTGSAYQLHWSTGSGSYAGSLSSTMPYTVNTWATFAVTHTTSGVLTYYFNGQQLGSQATGITFSQYLYTDSENVGASDNYWNGSIGVVGIWGSVLTAAQIVNCHNNLKSRYGL